MLKIEIVTADIREVHCDVMVLKYAQAFFGADLAVSKAVAGTDGYEAWTRLTAKDYLFFNPMNRVAAAQILVVGVVPLHEFEYADVRSFAKLAVRLISGRSRHAAHVAMTMHGVGFGLDERESFLAQIGGIADGCEEAGADHLRISIVEKDVDRASRLRKLLDETLQSSRVYSVPTLSAVPSVITAGETSKTKAHVFVAMPFNKDFEDVYEFGIKSPIHDSGLLCERADQMTFVGDILGRIKDRISTAALVVADLSNANPNVYLEVGYAWGKNRPTLLLSRQPSELKFDVQGQRCIEYENIVDLSKKLRADIPLLCGI